MVPRPFTYVVLFVVLASSTLSAAPATLLNGGFRSLLRSAVASRQPVVISGVDLGDSSLRELVLEPMKVWSDDATITVHDVDGTTTLAPPDILSFKGRVRGEQDSAVYISLAADGTVDGIILHGDRQFRIASARPAGRERSVDAVGDVAPIAVREYDEIDQLRDAETPWTCGIENQPIPPRVVDTVRATKLKVVGDAGNVAGAAYSLKLAIDTDTELYAAFGSQAAVSAYLTNLVGQASVIYQRDLSTTLTIGHANIYSGGTDPWALGAAAGTGSLLAELGTYYAVTDTIDYKQVQRSAVVMVSGKVTNAGVAWIDELCSGDFYCGDTGSNCNNGNPSTTYAAKYGGGYAWCGSAGSVSTVVPDPTLTVNGVQYGLPTSNYWMLMEFTHELGHVVSSQHTHCVTLNSAEQATYGVARAYVDTCNGTQGGCYSGSASSPPELGTIMSYCHNITISGFRQSRYTFGKAGEPSEKMLAILKFGDPTYTFPTAGLEGATPNGTMTTQAAPVACSSGRTASVPSCTGCTYAWQITGGAITSAANISAITYTPSASSVTLTVLVTSQRGCGITVAKTLATACSSVTAPTNVVASATSGSNILVTWTASAGATSYNVYRTQDNSVWTQVSTPGVVVGTTYNDAVSTNKAYKYRVRAVNGSESGDSNSDLAVAIDFTDPTLTAGVTAMKAAHVNELRAAVNALRTLNGNQGAFSFTDPSLTAGSTGVKAVHITELQTQLNLARVALGFTAATFTEVPVAGVTAIRKVHVEELRAGLQ